MTPKEDSLITYLAGLSLEGYERERKQAAKQLGMRLVILDKLVRERQKEIRNQYYNRLGAVGWGGMGLLFLGAFTSQEILMYLGLAMIAYILVKFFVFSPN